MADIIISHSIQDKDAAAAIGERIRRERPTWSLFYAKGNIRAGQRWLIRGEDRACSAAFSLIECVPVGCLLPGRSVSR